MELLSDVYESARINIPLAQFPDRASLVAWDDLEPRVHSELSSIAFKVESLVQADEQALANHRRVLGEFNRGLRSGLLGSPAAADSGPLLSESPYAWGHEIGRRTSWGGGTDPAVVRQLVTATSLLHYEFGQLDQARASPYDFVLRNVGPHRANELGELAFALPVLLNYHRGLVEEHLEADEYVPPAQSPAPSHLEYVACGVAALFDPASESWARVAANMMLAAKPFEDGTSLYSEAPGSPVQAADVVCRAPIAAHVAVRRQLERVLLARRWLGRGGYRVPGEEEPRPASVLWHVFQNTPAARIRGKESYFRDVLATNVIHVAAHYLESANPDGQTGFEFLRRHFSAFTRGFDSRVEGVVQPNVFSSAARGRAMSEGLRRFVDGGPLIAEISADLQELGRELNELHQAFNDPVGYVMETLERNDETPVAAHLLGLFRKHRTLPRELFRENVEYEMFSLTHVNTLSPFDLLRSALFQIARGVSPRVEFRGEATASLARARDALERIVALSTTPGERRPAGREELLATAALFSTEFDVLVRILESMVQRLGIARLLGKSFSASSQTPLDESVRAGTRG